MQRIVMTSLFLAVTGVGVSIGRDPAPPAGRALAAEEKPEKPGAPEMPPMPAPVKEHAWLQQLAGEWRTEGEARMGPDAPPEKILGTESARMLGGFWLVCEMKSSMHDMPFTGVLTLGYDPEQKKYVGVWVDSMGAYIWRLEGSVDASGKTLTLETEGPCCTSPGKLVKFREAIEVKGRDHRVFTSSILADDGSWQQVLRVDYRRKT